MHRFFYENLKNSATQDLVKLNKDENEHLFKILRAVPGDRVGLIDGAGTAADAIVEEGKMLRIENLTLFPIPALRIHVYVAAPRKQKMEQLLKQAGELGAWRIVPIQCERSVALPSGERIAKRGPDLLMEACKQSGNAYLPQLEDPLKCMDAIADAKAKCRKIFFGDPGITGQTFENIGMCLGLTPVIGLTIPFISYGGSSIISCFAAIGIVSGIRIRPNPIRRYRY